MQRFSSFSVCRLPPRSYARERRLHQRLTLFFFLWYMSRKLGEGGVLGGSAGCRADLATALHVHKTGTVIHVFANKETDAQRFEVPFLKWHNYYG